MITFFSWSILIGFSKVHCIQLALVYTLEISTLCQGRWEFPSPLLCHTTKTEISDARLEKSIFIYSDLAEEKMKRYSVSNGNGHVDFAILYTVTKKSK